MPAVDTLPQDLAAQVICSRVHFQEIHDALIKELSASDAVGAFTTEPFLSAVLGDDLTPPVNDIQAFTRAFAAAKTGGWLKPLVRRCLELMALDFKALDLMKPAGAPARRTVMQAAFDLAGGFPKPRAYASGLMRTYPKICLVSATLPGGGTQGTGFLIGPQTVLTAWHVIEPLLDDAGRPKAASHEKLRVEFDYVDSMNGNGARENVKSYEVAENWLLENSPCHVSEKPSSQGMPSKLLDESGIGGDHLDFAVLRLKGSPGRDRGVVRLLNESVPLRQGEQKNLFIFQHPNQFPQVFTSGPLIGFFGGGDPPPRLRHRANTSTGSSGGLCVNDDFESIAVHQATVVDAEGKPIENQAIPTSLIAPRLTAAFEVDPSFDPLWEIKDSREPVIGREKFQKSVWRVLRGETRVIVVRGQRRTGMSFSKHILRSMLPVKDWLVIEISADQVGHDAATFAKLLLERCGGKLAAGESFPDGSTAGTTPNAWLRDQLLPDLVRRIQGVVAGRQVWIVLEHLDRHDVPEDKARELLLALMSAATDAPFMRFLLLGVKNALPGVPTRLVEDDIPGWPVTDDIDLYIQRACTVHGIEMSVDERGRWVTAVMDEATWDAAAQANQWEAAANYLVKRVHKMRKDQ